MTEIVPNHMRTGAPAIKTLPRTRGRIVYDPQWCRTCKVCEAMCSIAKEGAARPALARINVTFDEFREKDPISATICAQCEDAACIDACPTEAMYDDLQTGAVLVDEERCIGCMKCRTACPWEVPKRHPERKVAIKCDLCSEREAPLCVAMCPLSGRALRFERSERSATGQTPSTRSGQARREEGDV